MVAVEPGQPPPSVLVVEDEPAIADLIRTYLERERFAVRVVGDGVTALDAVRRGRPSVVVLDVGLPGMDGSEVCRRMRQEGDWTPVLFVTARDDEVDRVLGLELGADDYVTKPFSPRELVARVKAVLRRHGHAPDAAPAAAAEGPALRAGAVVLDADTRRATAHGAAVELTTTEFDLLAHLMRRPGRVFPREELLADVWGYPAGTPTRTVDVHVAQLRAKLAGAVEVRTVRGVGYSVEP
ncbi:MAG: response regulator transcription factor [Actinobacteria bacterium]|nr:response regulator transcription factor [Actinomycetota bacterium]